jgi:hypothetical protein
VVFRNKQPVIWNLSAAAIDFKVELQSWWIQREGAPTGKSNQQLEMCA